jgi:hypothetical protein
MKQILEAGKGNRNVSQALVMSLFWVAVAHLILYSLRKREGAFPGSFSVKDTNVLHEVSLIMT